jgi:esterase/lipase
MGTYMLSRTAIDIAIIFFLFIMLLVEILTRQKTKLRIEGLEKKITAMQKYRSERFKQLDETFASFKEKLIENVNQLNLKINELSKKMNVIHEKYNTIGKELDKKVEPLQASFNDTFARINYSQEAMKKAIKESEEEMRKIAEGISTFAEEIKKMKDFIRERTIDLEL